MRVSSLLASPAPCFSFEFFAPKDEAGLEAFRRALDDLTVLSPGFISVTCGASGSKRQPSLDLVKALMADGRFQVMAHLTCQGQTRRSLESDLAFLKGLGVENVFALRGDPPRDEASAEKDAGAPQCGADFVRMVRASGHGFTVGAAAYPDVHPKVASPQADLDDLKRKEDAGAEFLVTQLFFDNGRFFDFVDRARRAGVSVPIVPGIMPITGFRQVKRFEETCGVNVPERLRAVLARHQDNPEAIADFGAAYATAQCMDLLAHGFRHLHFFTLNRSHATRAIVLALKGFHG